MSWDVFIMRFPTDARTPDDIPSDWQPEPLGTIGEVRAILKELVPDIVWDDTGWGSGTGTGFSVEVPLSGHDDEPINDVGLIFRGGGAAAYLALAVAERLGARAMDGGAGFLDSGNADAALAEWQAFRDQAVGMLVASERKPGKDSFWRTLRGWFNRATPQ
jgi:hypothetical protein